MERKKKILQAVIAHPIPEEQARLAELLESEGHFHVCCATHDGLECVRQVQALKPDLLILDTVLAQLNGLDVLRQVKAMEPCGTKCLMLTTHAGYVRDYARLMGADLCLLTPCTDTALVETARALTIPPETSFTDRQIDAETACILRELGVPERLKAYSYVKAGVRILLRDPDLIRRRCVVEELYGGIAGQFGVPGKQVERTIRTLTARLFDKGDRGYMARYFSLADLHQAHMTNTDLLSALTRCVKGRLTAAASAQSTVTL